MNIELLEAKAQALRETSKVLRAAITMLEESAKQAEQVPALYYCLPPADHH